MKCYLFDVLDLQQQLTGVQNRGDIPTLPFWRIIHNTAPVYQPLYIGGDKNEYIQTEIW